MVIHYSSWTSHLLIHAPCQPKWQDSCSSEGVPAQGCAGVAHNDMLCDLLGQWLPPIYLMQDIN